MLRRYSPERTESILGSLSPLLDSIEGDYGVPAACMKAILYREMTFIDLFDAAADLADVKSDFELKWLAEGKTVRHLAWRKLPLPPHTIGH